jgi:hypothetical protein
MWAFARKREPSSPVVDFTPMPNPRHRNQYLLIINRIDNPVIPNTNPPLPLPTLQLLATSRTRSEALEALAVEGYHTGRLTESELRQMLGYETRMQVHALLGRVAHI